MAPGEHLCIQALLGILPAKHNMASYGMPSVRMFYAVQELVDIIKIVLVYGGARFDFNGCQILPLFDEQVNFRPTGFPICQS